jgi:bifunctional DNA-binding transcriptional regulator/antitoxin component of YhaV-PrlF toxin-antitoxin module
MNKKYTVTVEQDPETQDLIMPLPEGMCDELGWKIGDTLNWDSRIDGSFILSKLETEWVLVECVSTFRIRYMVQVPKGKSDWALDTVTMNDAKEFSQEFLNESIVSNRVISKDEAVKLCDIDNEYFAAKDEDLKIKVFFTPWEAKTNDLD